MERPWQQLAYDFLQELSERIDGWQEVVDDFSQQIFEHKGTIRLYIYGTDNPDAVGIGVEAGPKGITVEFDNYHTHFRYSEGGPVGREHAFVFIQALQREAYAVASHYEGHKVLRTWVLNPIEGGAIGDYPLLDLIEPGTLHVRLPWVKPYVHVCSWAGSFDRWYDLQQARQNLKLPRYSGEIIDFDSE